MQKLYVAMVGLPARGKSTLARRIRQGLLAEGIRPVFYQSEYAKYWEDFHLRNDM